MQAVNLFQKLKSSLVLRGRIIQLFFCFVVVCNFIAKHTVVYESHTAECFNEQHSLFGIRIYSEFVRFISDIINPFLTLVLIILYHKIKEKSRKYRKKASKKRLGCTHAIHPTAYAVAYRRPTSCSIMLKILDFQ